MPVSDRDRVTAIETPWAVRSPATAGGDDCMKRVNYDEIADKYDEPSRDHGVDANLIAFLRVRSPTVTSRVRLLDVGCGTGKQIQANRAAFPGAAIVGTDLSIGMLRIARGRCRDVPWVQGDGSNLPFRHDAFDYVSNQFSYPHMQEKERFIAEVLRVLRPGGRFVMTNVDPWSMDGWILYRFFPEARELDHRDFMTAEEFCDAMRSAGFAYIETRREHRRTRERLGEYLAYASERHRTSHFMAMSDAEYRAGLGRVERAVAAAHPEDTVPSETCLLTIRGDKPR